MDCEKLIELVREREEIYNSKHIHHRNRDLIAAIWEDIGDKLRTSDVEAKRKWQNLRSNYMRERRKLKTKAPGAEAYGTKVGWPFFSMMSFLDNGLKNRGARGSLAGDSVEWQNVLATSRASEFGSVDEDVHSCKYEETYVHCDTDPLELVTLANPKREIRKRDSSDGEVDRYDMKKLEKLSSSAMDDNDPDLLFFKSLLPHIKLLDINKKLTFKVEVAQLLKRILQPGAHTAQ